MKILVCYGTRPEWIKIQPIIDQLTHRQIPHTIVFTGQHQDIANFKYDIKMVIGDGNNRLDCIVQSIMDSTIFDDPEVTHVMIQGDTTTCLAVAISAFHHRKQIIHVEAGLRTYDNDNPYPEESNRRMIGCISNINLCPTTHNRDNLLSERATGRNFVVGNTVLDTIDRTGCVYDDYVLVTLHRRENHDLIDQYFECIETLANENPHIQFILPIHPNPNVQKHRGMLSKVTVVSPMNRDDLLQLLKKCRIVISDSGGIQEECSYLNKKVIVCRKVTERPESVGIHSFMCDSPTRLREVFYQHFNDYVVNAPCPYGDGHSAETIAEIFANL